MALENFYALAPTAPLQEAAGQVRAVPLSSLELGEVAIPSGLVGVADPLAGVDTPLVFAVPAGTYRVVATVADVAHEQASPHLRTAYLSLLLSDELPARVTPATPVGDHEPTGGSFYGVPVDAGTVAFFDAPAMESFIKASDAHGESDALGETWLDTLEATAPLPENFAHVHFPSSVSWTSVAMASSGWGDGFYPVLETFSASGALTGLHIDLLVVGVSEAEAESGGEASSIAAAPPEEVEKLRKTVQDYGGSWPAFLVLGSTFLIIGLQNFAFLPIGIVFVAVSATFAAEANKAKKRLQLLGFPVRPKPTIEGPHGKR